MGEQKNQTNKPWDKDDSRPEFVKFYIYNFEGWWHKYLSKYSGFNKEPRGFQRTQFQLPALIWDGSQPTATISLRDLTTLFSKATSTHTHTLTYSYTHMHVHTPVHTDAHTHTCTHTLSHIFSHSHTCMLSHILSLTSTACASTHIQNHMIKDK